MKNIRLLVIALSMSIFLSGCGKLGISSPVTEMQLSNVTPAADETAAVTAEHVTGLPSGTAAPDTGSPGPDVTPTEAQTGTRTPDQTADQTEQTKPTEPATEMPTEPAADPTNDQTEAPADPTDQTPAAIPTEARTDIPDQTPTDNMPEITVIPVTGTPDVTTPTPEAQTDIPTAIPATATRTPAGTPTPPTATPEITAVPPTRTSVVTAVPATATPTKAPTATPTKAPTATPTKAPTQRPATPTKAPTATPTKAPTQRPATPTKAPTATPTATPEPEPTAHVHTNEFVEYILEYWDDILSPYNEGSMYDEIVLFSCKDYGGYSYHESYYTVYVSTCEICGEEMYRMTDKALIDRFISYINDERAKLGRDPIILDERLCQVAQIRTEQMREHGFGHSGDDTTIAFESVFGKEAFSRFAYGENICEPGSYKTAFIVWKGSPGHWANLMSYKYIGIATDYKYTTAIFTGNSFNDYAQPVNTEP